MGRTFAKLIVPFTFSEEDEYRVSLSKRVALIRIKHIRNNDGIESIKGIKFHGNPKIIPDDPEGSMYISSIEIELPYTPRDLKSLGGLEVEFVKYHVMSYLNRLTETIRFSTRRYWTKMISEKDIDIYDIEFEENSGGKWSIPLIVGVQSGYNFPLTIFNENRVKKFITEILTKEIQLPLSENLYFDALNFYYSGRFSESIVVANISFEVFLNTYLIEKLSYEGKSIEDAKDFVENMYLLPLDNPRVIFFQFIERSDISQNNFIAFR